MRPTPVGNVVRLPIRQPASVVRRGKVGLRLSAAVRPPHELALVRTFRQQMHVDICELGRHSC